MTGFRALLKKDFTSYCRSWAGVLVLFVFLLISGIFFTLFVLSYSQLSMEAAQRAYEGIEGLSLTGFIMGAFYRNLGALFLFLSPLLSMRSFSEERRGRTLELLYTYPLGDFEIVLAKYLALLAQLALLFLPTFLYAALVGLLGSRLDTGVILCGALGFFLLAASFLSTGLFFSSLTENQIVAGALSFAFLMALWVLEWLSGFLPVPWSYWLGALTPFRHFRDFTLGILDLSDLVYFLCLSAFFLFLTLRVVETRNWKG